MSMKNVYNTAKNYATMKQNKLLFLELEDNDIKWIKLYEYVIFLWKFQTSVLCEFELITVAKMSKVRNIFARSSTGVVDSNPTRGIDVCLFLLCLFCPV
jgi:hypothetical protein